MAVEHFDVLVVGAEVRPTSLDAKAAAPFVENFTPGYMRRALASWPKQGSKPPWRVYQNYIRDTISLKWSSIDNDALEFSNPPTNRSAPLPEDLVHMVR